eukprot:1180436-Prorocentrum_minimum.AAC.2
MTHKDLQGGAGGAEGETTPAGRGGLQGTRPRARQLGGPASRGLSVRSGSRPSSQRPPLAYPQSSSTLSLHMLLILFSKCLPRLACWPSTTSSLGACSPTSSLGAWGW